MARTRGQIPAATPTTTDRADWASLAYAMGLGSSFVGLSSVGLSSVGLSSVGLSSVGRLVVRPWSSHGLPMAF